MMSMVGAAVAPDTAAAPVLGDDPLHGGKGFDRRRWRSFDFHWGFNCGCGDGRFGSWFGSGRFGRWLGRCGFRREAPLAVFTLDKPRDRPIEEVEFVQELELQRQSAVKDSK